MTETLLGGRYRLDELIGRGGMATVWRATDSVLGRAVAVKRLHAGLMADDELTERFRREALLVARLSHPNLVHVLDRGDDADGPFLVLELVEGENLKARIRREGPLEPAHAARICAQVARALEYAHGQGVVHRDIKAQNVLLAPEGTAKLADFGIARMMESGHEVGLTRTDMLLGSADYLSPEQANGHALDARSDVYSLGIVLFEAVTATLPFTGDGFVAVAMKHCSQPMPDPRTVVPSTPPWLAEAVMHATRKDPAERYPDAGAFAQALEDGAMRHDNGTAVFRAVDVPPPEPTPHPADPGAAPVRDARDEDTAGATALRRRPRRRGRSTAVIAAGLVLLGAAGAGGAWLMRDTGTGATDGPTRVDPAQVVDLPVASVRDLDPTSGGGDGSENPEQRDLAIDGDPATAWYTERYQDTPAFGGLKSGVGMLVRLRRPAVVTALRLTSPTPGATFEIQGVQPGGGRPVLARGTFTGAAQTVTIPPGAATTDHIVWITGLAPTDDGRYTAGIAEIAVRGVPRAADG